MEDMKKKEETKECMETVKDEKGKWETIGIYVKMKKGKIDNQENRKTKGKPGKIQENMETKRLKKINRK